MKIQCERCNRFFTANTQTAFCPNCEAILAMREQHRKWREQAHIIKHNEQPDLEGYHKRKEREKRATSSRKTIAEINTLARAAGMSYGQYVASMGEGKK